MIIFDGLFILFLLLNLSLTLKYYREGIEAREYIDPDHPVLRPVLITFAVFFTLFIIRYAWLLAH